MTAATEFLNSYCNLLPLTIFEAFWCRLASPFRPDRPEPSIQNQNYK